jgi:chemotaxis protein MotB
MLEVEGHTQKGAEVTSTPQGEGWDLSTSRAVAARDVLQSSGLEPDRFWRVIGYSDRIPLEGVKPEAEENRRITIVARLKSDSVQRLTQDTLP